MTINKIDPVWASDGTSGYTTPPATSKIERGWAPREQPANSYENWSKNRLETKINDIVVDSIRNRENDAAQTQAQEISALPPLDVSTEYNAINNPYSTSNRIYGLTAGANHYYDLADICRGYDFKNSRECLFGLSRANPSIVWVFNTDKDDNTIEYTSVTVADDLSGDSPVNIICDGLYIYITVNDGDDSASTIYKYALSEASIIETTKTAYLHVGSSNIFRANNNYQLMAGKQICVADSTHLAILDHVNNRIGIMTKALGSAPTYGTGTIGSLVTSDYDIVPAPGIVSSGNHVWFVTDCTIEGVNACVLCAALISDPTSITASLGLSDYLLICVDTNDGANPEIAQSIAFDGESVVMLSCQYTADNETHCGYLYRFNIEAGSWERRQTGIPAIFCDLHNMTYARACAMTFTGRRIAIVAPCCAVDDMSSLTIANFNLYQRGAMFTNPRSLPKLAGASGDVCCEVSNSEITCLDTFAPSDGLRVNAIAYVDGDLWIAGMFYHSSNSIGCLTRLTATHWR